MNEHTRTALLYALWHHQGGHSPEGQALRKLLGMGQFDRLSSDQVRQVQELDSFLNGEAPDWKRRAIEAEAKIKDLGEGLKALSVRTGIYYGTAIK